MEFIQYHASIPLSYEVDVAVIGGGMAGVSAACAAAREGARVLLVEYFATTGGNATIGGVANWSGETRGQGAIFDEIIAMQEAWGAIDPYLGEYEHFALSSNRIFEHSVLEIILQELLRRHNVHTLLHTCYVGARMDGNRIEEVIIRGSSGPEAVRAKVFIDCTGEAHVARSAGFATSRGRDGDGMPLPASLMFFVREMMDGKPVPQLPEGWFNPVRKEDDLPMTSIWPHGAQAKALKVKIPGYDSTDTEELTKMEIRARERMYEVLDYYQRVEKKPWRFDHCSPRIGLREGRRIIGDYVLTLDDIRAGCAFDDGVARGVFYLDGMTPDCEKRTYIIPKEEQGVPPYHIPLRSLIARDGENLLMAGRCFSADQLTLSSARVMPTCSMMGQAVGIWAARSADLRCAPRQVESAYVTQKVLQYGANLEVGTPAV